MLAFLMPIDAYAEGPLKIVGNILVLVGFVYIVIAVLKSGKKKFDDSVVGLSMNVKKEKLKKELEKLNKDNKN